MPEYVPQFMMASYRNDATFSSSSQCPLRSSPPQEYPQVPRPNNMNTLPSLSELGLLDINTSPERLAKPYPLAPLEYHIPEMSDRVRGPSGIFHPSPLGARRPERRASPPSTLDHTLSQATYTLERMDLTTENVDYSQASSATIDLDDVANCSPAGSITYLDYEEVPADEVHREKDAHAHAPTQEAPVKLVRGSLARTLREEVDSLGRRKTSAPRSSTSSPKEADEPLPSELDWKNYVEPTSMQDMQGAQLFRCTFKSCGHEQTKQAVKRHINDVHLDLRPWPCPFCTRSFKQNMSRTIHVCSVHTLETPFKCEHCERAFSDPARRNKHVKADHPEKPCKTRPKVAYPKHQSSALGSTSMVTPVQYQESELHQLM